MGSTVRFHLIACAFVVSACSTAEYDQAWDGCSQIAHSKFPVSVQNYPCQRMKYVEVPTGETVCTTDVELGKIVERCKVQTERKAEYYDSTCRGDINMNPRREWTLKCTANACFQTFGNVSCKTK